MAREAFSRQTLRAKHRLQSRTWKRLPSWGHSMRCFQHQCSSGSRQATTQDILPPAKHHNILQQAPAAARCELWWADVQGENISGLLHRCWWRRCTHLYSCPREQRQNLTCGPYPAQGLQPFKLRARARAPTAYCTTCAMAAMQPPEADLAASLLKQSKDVIHMHR